MAICAMAVIMAGLLASNAQAQPSDTPREETWITDGTVRAIVRMADIVYIGGRFTYVGPCKGSGVPIDTATGSRLASFPKVNGAVRACVPDGSGGWYIGGEFTQVGSYPRKSIAHILYDYKVDVSWDPNAKGEVYALKVSGSTVYVGGDFTSIGGQERNYIAVLDATTGNATAWNPNANNYFNDLVVSGSTVYTGGRFTNIDGQARNYIAASETDWHDLAKPSPWRCETFYQGITIMDAGRSQRSSPPPLFVKKGVDTIQRLQQRSL